MTAKMERGVLAAGGGSPTLHLDLGGLKISEVGAPWRLEDDDREHGEEIASSGTAPSSHRRGQAWDCFVGLHPSRNDVCVGGDCFVGRRAARNDPLRRFAPAPPNTLLGAPAIKPFDDAAYLGVQQARGGLLRRAAPFLVTTCAGGGIATAPFVLLATAQDIGGFDLWAQHVAPLRWEGDCFVGLRPPRNDVCGRGDCYGAGYWRLRSLGATRCAPTLGARLLRRAAPGSQRQVQAGDCQSGGGDGPIATLLHDRAQTAANPSVILELEFVSFDSTTAAAPLPRMRPIVGCSSLRAWRPEKMAVLCTSARSL